MFTQQPAFGGGTSLFGTANTGFGQATPAFGQAASSQQQAGTSLFGARPTVSFNTPLQSQPGQTLFGGTQTPGTSLFGTTQQTPTTGTSLFGQGTTFGQTPAASTGTGLFGTSLQQRPLFGATATPAFGSTAVTSGVASLFGTTATSQPTAGLFGQTATTMSTGLFGTSTPVASTQTMPNGTGTVKFNPPLGSDTMMKNNIQSTISTKHQCITGMTEYQMKSFEELRVDDYLAGRKGKQATGLFGATPFQPQPAQNALALPTAGGLFGTQTTSAAAPSLFSFSSAQPTASTAAQPLAGGGLFGGRSLFGTAPAATTTTQSTGFTFGAPTASTGTGLFGAPAQPAQTGLFGQTTSQAQPFGTAPLTFGATPAPAGGFFNKPAPAFGTTTTTAAAPSLFGQPAAAQAGFAGFGQTQLTTGSLFQPKQSVAPFGAPASAAPTFGAAGFGTTGFGAAGQGLFGQAQAQQRPLFSTPATGFGTTGSLFGGTGTSAAPSLFSNTNTAPGGLFGSNAARPLFGGTSAAPSVGFGGGTSLFGSAGTNALGGTQQQFNVDPNLAQQQLLQQQALAAVMQSPYGYSKLLSSIYSTAKSPEIQPTNPIMQRNALNASLTAANALKTGSLYGLSPTISPRPLSQQSKRLLPLLLSGSRNSSANKSSLLFDESDPAADSSLGKEGFVPKKNVKKLILKPRILPDQSAAANGTIASMSRGISSFNDEDAITTRILPHEGQNGSIPRLNLNHSTNSQISPDPDNQRRTASNNYMNDIAIPTPIRGDAAAAPASPNAESFVIAGSAATDSLSYSKVLCSPPIHESTARQPKSAMKESPTGRSNFSMLVENGESSEGIGSVQPDGLQEPEPHIAGIILTKPEYYTEPNLEQLALMTDANGECVATQGFRVGRTSYGSVFWRDAIKVSNLNLDDIIHFRHKEVTVYPDDAEKPPVGVGLNRPAEVTLERVWPNDKSTHLPIKSPERLQMMKYREKLERATAEMGATFVDYRPETGCWVFRVPHFSKYGLEDEADEEGPDQADLAVLRSREKVQADLQRLKPIKQIKIVPDAYHPREHMDLTGKDAMMSEDLSVSAFYEKQKELLDEVDNEDMNEGEKSIEKSAKELEGQKNSCVILSSGTEHLNALLGIGKKSVSTMRQSFFASEFESDSRVDQLPFRAPVLSNTISTGEPPVSPPVFGRLSELKQKQSTLVSQSPAEKSDFNLSLSKRQRQHAKPGLVSLYEQSQRLVSACAADEMTVLDSQHMELSSFDVSDSYKLAGPNQEIGKFEKKPTSLFSSISAPKSAPKVQLAAPSFPPRLVPYGDSVAVNRHKCFLDAGAFHGRRFRVGWAKDKKLVHLGKVFDADKDEIEPPNQTRSFLKSKSIAKSTDVLPRGDFTVAIEKVQSDSSLCTRSLLEDLLNCQLAQSDFVQTGSGFPMITPLSGIETLHQYQSIALTNSSDPNDIVLTKQQEVWDLCVALFGRLPDFDDFELAARETPYAYHMARKRVLSEWLAKYTQMDVDSEVEQAKGTNDGPKAVLSLLSAHRISEAAQLAFKNGDLRLSLVISAASGSGESRKLCREQLLQWRNVGADDYITGDRLKIFALISGCMCWDTSNGTVVNTCEGLEWKRAFGQHLWYSCDLSATIADGLAEFEAAFLGSSPHGFYADPPSSEAGQLDVCYQLIKLSVDRSHRIAALLNPESYAPPGEVMDYHLSWHLWCVLESLGYSHIPPAVVVRLHLRYANQLQEMGLWMWSVFVLCHIAEENLRESKIKETLAHFCNVATDEEFSFLRDQLFIPKEWIFSAKALLAKERNQYTEEAWFALKAGEWNLAHNLFLAHAAPKAVANEDAQTLRRFLDEFLENSDQIFAWPVGGLIYAEYLKLLDHIEMLKQGEPTRATLLEIKPVLISIASRIDGLRCDAPIQRLAQGEMGKRVACMFRLITEESDWMSLSETLTKLPMPDDYLLEEIQKLANSCLQTLEPL